MIKNPSMSKLRSLLRSVTLVTAVSIGLTPAAHGTDPSLIRGAFIEFPPLAYTTDDGKVEGTFIALAEDVAARAGYDIRWQELPIERVYLYLENGRIDMWLGTAGVPELEAYTHETDFHTGSVRLNAYSREGSPPVSGIEDLQGKRLILIRGYTYWRLLDHLKDDPDTVVTMAPNHRSAGRMLALRRGDYLINFQSPMDNIQEHSSLPEFRQDNLLSWPLTLIFSKKAPGTGKMIEDLNRAWRIMHEEAEIITQEQFAD